MRGTGGKFYGENLMNHLFRRDVSFWMLEGSSLAVPKAKERLAAMLPGSLRTVILRHPIERILSRYWMEGRWDLFKQASAESATFSSIVLRVFTSSISPPVDSTLRMRTQCSADAQPSASSTFSAHAQRRARSA